MRSLIKFNLNPDPTPLVNPDDCTHPNLRDCGEDYWWCMKCGGRFTSAELAEQNPKGEPNERNG